MFKNLKVRAGIWRPWKYFSRSYSQFSFVKFYFTHDRSCMYGTFYSCRSSYTSWYIFLHRMKRLVTYFHTDELFQMFGGYFSKDSWLVFSTNCIFSWIKFITWFSVFQQQQDFTTFSCTLNYQSATQTHLRSIKIAIAPGHVQQTL